MTVTAIAAAHICSTIPNFLALEYHSANIPLWSVMLETPGTEGGPEHGPIHEGYLTVPDEPGLGIRLNEAAIAETLGDSVGEDGIWL